MSSETLEIAKTEYQAGKAAFERGRYRESVQHLEKASALVARNTRLGGEVQIWLVTAYEAAGQRTEAIALCKQVTYHPDISTRKQARRLLYILEAPKLNTRPEWLTQIPDLATLTDSDAKARQGSAAPTKRKPKQPEQPELEEFNLSQDSSKTTQFLWICLILVGLILGALAWMS